MKNPAPPVALETPLERRPWCAPEFQRLDGRQTSGGIYANTYEKSTYPSPDGSYFPVTPTIS